MDEKYLQTLEFYKILERLASYTAFAVSAEKALALRPTDDVVEATRRQAETSEAVQLLVTHQDLTIGGARDVREAVDLARHSGVLPPNELLNIKSTLIAGRNLTRTFERLGGSYPNLYEIVMQLPTPTGLIDNISRVISERGEILDSASERLESIRHNLRVVHERLVSKMQRMANDPKNAPYLQEVLITQRDGRYVLPLRAEFKGRIRSIVHDQSSSGATLFVEPLSVVEMNNEYRELQLAERDEERRILADLSLQVGKQAESILLMIDLIADLDLALARARYAEEIRATEPILHPIKAPRKGPVKNTGPVKTAGMADSTDDEPPSTVHHPPSVVHPGTVIQLYQARHPLLDPQTVVPIDVELDPETFVLIITGPNTGGKTVTLKTVGLLALMAQAGLHIPVHSGSQISVFDAIYADIGDEQSIEQSLSTFSGHITNIIHILENADARSLVVLDELGAGTDPQEGAALARSILSNLLRRSITTLVTTHHPELKAFAHATPGAVNASVEFDLETLRPTYHLTIGLPGRSNALAIAQRLGLPEALIAEARSELDPQDLHAEDLLDEIHRQRDVARQARAAADQARQEAESLRAALAIRLENLEQERRETLEKARLEAEAELYQVQAEIQEVRRALARARQPVDEIQALDRKVQDLEETIQQPIEPAVPQIEALERRAIKVGDKVRLRSLNLPGVVKSLVGEDTEVQVGALRIRARLGDLELPGRIETQPISPEHGKAQVQPRPRPEKKQVEPVPLTGAGSTTTPVRGSGAAAGMRASPGMELNLRGQRADDALDALDRFLDAAYLSGLPFVRIIHGKGTGRLREVVRQALAQNPHVRSYEAGGDKEGGEGVTVALLHAS